MKMVNSEKIGKSVKEVATKPSKKTVRDDFSQQVKDKLRFNSGGVCSNPDCMVFTFGPTTENRDGHSSIGVAAHISAAAPGPGARRYDKNMTREERRAEENGIWLLPVVFKTN